MFLCVKEVILMKHMLFLIIFGMLMIPACSHTGISSADLNTLSGTEWVLEDLGGRGVADSVQSTIIFKTKDRIVGWGGCNRYFSVIRSDGHSINIGPIGSTRRICPAVVMDQEERFLKALEKANRISRQDAYLLIHSQDLEKPLKFTRVQRPDS
jgi:heat shock protein HslJ